MLCATLLRALDSAVCHLLLVQFQYYVEPHLQNHMRIVQTHAHTSKMMYFNLRHVLIHHYKPATCSRVLLAWVWVRVRVCAFVWISKAIVVIREWAPAFRYSNCLCHFHLKREPTRKENTQTRARSLTYSHVFVIILTCKSRRKGNESMIRFGFGFSAKIQTVNLKHKWLS